MAYIIKDFIDQSLGSFFITDIRGSIVYANRAVTLRTGYLQSEMIGQKPGNLWGGRMSKKFYERLWRTIRDNKKPFIGDVENKYKTGGHSLQRLRIAPIVNSFGDPIYYFEIQPYCEDIFSEANFYEIFSSGGSASSSTVLSWLYKMTIPDDSILDNSINDVLPQSLDLFFEKSFINPLREEYDNRYQDFDLIKQAQGDPQLFSILYDKYYHMIYQYFFQRLSGDEMSAHDFSQEVFIRALASLSNFRCLNASYATYLKRIAHNFLVNYYRAKYMEPSLSDHDVFFNDMAQTRLESDFIWQKLKSFTVFEQTIMRMYYWQGYGTGDIAKHFDKSESAIKSRIKRIKKKLYQFFNR